jgi:hypothetical protein
MNLRSVTYVTVKEVKEGAFENEKGLKDKRDVVTDSSNNSEPDFDASDNNA